MNTSTLVHILADGLRVEGMLEQVTQQAALWFAGHFAPIPHA